ncbi:hypothetical protein [Actinomadura parmotrematis]|uniref:DUF308 domain-containing protein n=1 Tax=Actinomadura parmotrematis TaxID=2864039 RepID=A0ABS7FKI9_9ACTN|nr:hypothetical protein [Actinomadura parmotrematis]MBW8480876.1 hypothetical protein [Actinomadura parmotrematis]
MNRRGNGLIADAYAPLVDLAPHLADAMLSALREAGVAAYATPGAADGAARPPAAGPGAAADEDDALDRLYVDVELKPTAEGVLQAHLAQLRDTAGQHDDHRPPPAAAAAAQQAPAPPAGEADAPERDEDAIWAEIVAGFDSAPADGERVPWPDQENLSEPRRPPAEGDDRTGRLPRARVVKPAGEEDPAGFDAPGDEGHYIPPAPPPLPSADPLTKGAWIALVGGPLYLLATVIMDWYVPGWAAFLAVAAFIGGFVTLVLRMGDEPRDPDDGAVV